MDANIIQGIALITVAVIEALAQRDRNQIKKITAKHDERETLRKRESLLQLQMEDASIKLAMIIAKKVQNQKTNGDVEEAYKAAQKAKEEYHKFLNDVAMTGLERRD